MTGRVLGDIFPNLSKKQYVERFETIFTGGPSAIFSSLLHKHLIPVPLKDGGFMVQHTIVTPITGPAGEICAVMCVQDVTELNMRAASYRDMRNQALKEIEERKKAQEELILASKVIESATDGVMITEPDLTIVSINRGFTEITGFTSEEIVGKKPDLLKSGKQDRDYYERMWRTLEETGQWQGEIWDRRKSGEIFAAWLRIAAIKSESGAVGHYVGVFTDYTERKLKEQKLEFLANHDPLTGLPNRVAFSDRLEMAVDRARRSSLSVAVMYIDLDRFKPINDELGHHMGDAVLQEVAHRLRSCVRKVDTVARLGGDEFVIIMQELPSYKVAESAAEKILSELSRPIIAVGNECRISASIGACLYPYDGEDTSTLVKIADAVMYQVKDSGRGAVKFNSASYPETEHETGD